ncbi:hypothetical protein O3S68_07480 [Kosakonia sp. SOY2]|uniref:hypothetical protein n=1 Tax=Kosakonia sp. SOY2 TaxID=3014557 RepID=UPI0022ABFC61|nr:hypothetical protein [Kosakonia sp. SOY2]MCZ3382135.1 hypothetical protein [Kosakonia sp. SOY2]
MKNLALSFFKYEVGVFSFCSVHTVACNATVSKAINEALEKNIIVNDIIRLTIVQPDDAMAKQHILVERTLLDELNINCDGEYVLYDRDRENKKMNDRVVINKLSSYLCDVCPICLFEKTGFKSI